MSGVVPPVRALPDTSDLYFERSLAMKFSGLFPATAFALIVLAPGIAASQQAAPGSTTTQTAQSTPSGVTTTTTTTTATGFMKLDDMHVVGPNGEKIGEISDALVDASGRLAAVAVEAGGFLGMGDRDVIVTIEQLRFEGNHFVTTMTKDQMKALPEWRD
jgi:hypothetical protein